MAKAFRRDLSVGIAGTLLDCHSTGRRPNHLMRAPAAHAAVTVTAE